VASAKRFAAELLRLVDREVLGRVARSSSSGDDQTRLLLLAGLLAELARDDAAQQLVPGHELRVLVRPRTSSGRRLGSLIFFSSTVSSATCVSKAAFSLRSMASSPWMSAAKLAFQRRDLPDLGG